VPEEDGELYRIVGKSCLDFLEEHLLSNPGSPTLASADGYQNHHSHRELSGGHNRHARSDSIGIANGREVADGLRRDRKPTFERAIFE
jgi:hypothetical protein